MGEMTYKIHIATMIVWRGGNKGILFKKRGKKMYWVTAETIW